MTRLHSLDATQTSSADRLIKVARYIEAHAQDKLTLQELAQMVDLSPSYLQRQFKQAFGVSAKAYQDAIRLGIYKQTLQASEDTSAAIYAAGFGSTSRVYGVPARNLGMSPKAYQKAGQDQVIAYAVCDTKLGLLAMAATDKGVCFAQFGDSAEALIAAIHREFKAAVIVASDSQNSPMLAAWIEALNQHISHGSAKPELPLDMRGTVFQIQVWEFLLQLKPQATITYSQVAIGINKPKACRAVATACAKNTIGVLIPCHKVLRSDGSLGGYRWGTERKQALLHNEGSVSQPSSQAS
jgi:AraC family transcriptional regulator of adaptative response/methylated-DNA-[protein]-cysteine methyltransferase